MMMMMMTRWSWQVLWRCCRYRARSRARPVCRRSCSSTRQQRSPQVQTPTTRSRPRPGRPTTSWCRSSRRPTTVTCFFVVTRKSTNYSSPRVTSSLSRRHPVPLLEGRRLCQSDVSPSGCGMQTFQDPQPSHDHVVDAEASERHEDELLHALPAAGHLREPATWSLLTCRLTCIACATCSRRTAERRVENARRPRLSPSSSVRSIVELPFVHFCSFI